MSDYHKIRAFELANELVLGIYRVTQTFPHNEQFGLTSQIRRAAVSIASNIVEGSARNSEADFLRFLDIAYGSSVEVEYQLFLAHQLNYLPEEDFRELNAKCNETVKVINGLICYLRKPRAPTTNQKLRSEV